MQINIHNKFEIVQGDEKYVAYNTISHNILDRIASLSPFATYFAFGNAVGADSYARNKMENWILSLPTTLEDIQTDVSKGQIFVKRCITIGENQQVGLTFSELGITYSSDNNPTICNHVNIVDGQGNTVQIRKKSGIALFIRVTIFLSFSNDAKKILCSGDNKLVRALLGEYQAPTITAMRGENLMDNSKSIKRNTPRVGTRYACNLTSSIAQDNSACTINFDFDLDTGATGEVVILFDDYAVARYNVLALGETENETLQATSKSNRCVPLDNYVLGVTSITDSESAVISNYQANKYATEFGDFVASPFDTTITDDTARFVSEDGDKIAFLVGGKVYLYQNVGYSFEKIENNIDTENLTKLIIFEDNVFAIYNGLPRMCMYKIVNQVLEKKTIDFTNYTLFDSTFDWREIEIISDGQNSFMIGIILGQILRRPVIATATYANNTLTIDSAQYGTCNYICNMFALYRNSYCDSRIAFITNNYGGQSDAYRIEEHAIGEQTVVSNEIPAYYLSGTGATSVKGYGRYVVATLSTSPYSIIYYYPEIKQYSLSIEGIKNWFSHDLLHVVQKYNDVTTPYKIYSMANYSTLTEFTGGFPSGVNLSTLTDFEFVGNILLMFSDSGVQALTLKDVNTVIDNLPVKNASYTIAYTKVVPIGTSTEDGVNALLSIEVTP